MALKQRPKSQVMTSDEGIFVLGQSRLQEGGKIVDLRDVGFIGKLSPKAREEIARNEARASRVLTTAARFAFR